jgi:hypothetical protein
VIPSIITQSASTQFIIQKSATTLKNSNKEFDLATRHSALQHSALRYSA